MTREEARRYCQKNFTVKELKKDLRILLHFVVTFIVSKAAGQSMPPPA